MIDFLQRSQSNSGSRLLGALKVHYQRSGVVMRTVTMLSAMTAAYSTTPQLQAVFGSFFGFVVAAGFLGLCWMVFDYLVVLPSEHTYNQGQAERRERSPQFDKICEIEEKLDALAEESDLEISQKGIWEGDTNDSE